MSDAATILQCAKVCRPRTFFFQKSTLSRQPTPDSQNTYEHICVMGDLLNDKLG